MVRVDPFAMLCCGAMHVAANSFLYKYVDAVTAKWKHGHTLNSLMVQSHRAAIARIAMTWSYYGHAATITNNLSRHVPPPPPDRINHMLVLGGDGRRRG